jgi:acetyl-CoA carboxylase carboxyl transferase subunit alpha
LKRRIFPSPTENRFACPLVLPYIGLMPDQMRSYLDFEKPVAELDSKVDELRALAASGTDIGEEVTKIEEKASHALADLYANLTPSAASALHRLRQCAHHRIHPACRRPQICR